MWDWEEGQEFNFGLTAFEIPVRCPKEAVSKQ